MINNVCIYIKKFRKQIWYDFKVGLFVNWYKFIPILVAVFLLCLQFQQKISVQNLMDGTNYSGSFLDYLINLFKGMNIFIPSSDKFFKIPASWSIIIFYLVFLFSNFTYKDYKIHGEQTLLRCKSKMLWWTSKYIWIIINVCFYYFIIYFVVFCFTFIESGLFLEPNIHINLMVSEVNISSLTTADLLILVFILPVITSISIALVEVVISILWSPIISIMCISSLLIGSAYYCNNFLIGNYTMMLRNEKVINQSGVLISFGCVVNCFLLIATYFIGYWIIKKGDIIAKNKI